VTSRFVSVRIQSKSIPNLTHADKENKLVEQTHRLVQYQREAFITYAHNHLHATCNTIN
jgi:hypothetical protein